MAARSTWLGSVFGLEFQGKHRSMVPGYPGWWGEGLLGSLPYLSLLPGLPAVPLFITTATGGKDRTGTVGTALLPVFPCPSDPQVSVGSSWARPAPGTGSAGTGLGIAACGSRQGEEQPQQFCVKRRYTAA